MNNLNLNIDQKTLEMCLKTIDNIGSTTYQNICTGQSTVVQWGSAQWGTLFGVIIMITTVFSFIVRVMYLMYKTSQY